tara:strand:+ start:1104 stop:1217 length:114 start_codon:yes stop_codon:yes gene_type:complete
MTKEIEKLIRDEYSGDKNPRPDLLADQIIAKIKGGKK